MEEPTDAPAREAEGLQPLAAAEAAAPSDAAARPCRVSVPLRRPRRGPSPEDVSSGTRHAAETGAMGVLAGRERLPAVCRNPAVGRLQYSRAGDAVVRSAWGTVRSPTGTAAAAAASSSAPRTTAAKTRPSTTRCPSWGKFALRQEQHLAPIKQVANTATAAPCVTATKPPAPSSRRNSPELIVSPSKHALFDRAYEGLLRERTILERISAIVEEVRNAAISDAAAAAEASNELHIMYNPLADATAPPWTKEDTSVSAEVATLTFPALPSIARPQTACCNGKNRSSVRCGCPASAPRPQLSLAALLREQRGSLGIPEEPSISEAEHGTLLPCVTRPANNPQA
ncbi:uncharacterized protein Tco025E_02746 [Trypanosoma conorhini]|uniref:Uncharacterized protein n=1 Tax=Trypanosoma conorhini TaxID=83891 RepID=A0A422Q0X7_9TRYP|nr:uncharacterized protein Tco025E_02746 [Trypanosoma conorhini]RNF23646.1 hypothetical protein Tco025E_02746 [Trypanosoma conorhini]